MNKQFRYVVLKYNNYGKIEPLTQSNSKTVLNKRIKPLIWKYGPLKVWDRTEKCWITLLFKLNIGIIWNYFY